MVGALGASASAKDLTYKVTYDLAKGQYMSSATCSPGCDEFGGIHSLSESDEHFTTEVVFNDLKIPKKGNPAPPGSPLSLKASEWDEKTFGNWHLSETYWTQDNPNAPVKCHGILFDADKKPPHIFSTTKSSAASLDVDIQAGELFKPSAVQGTNCDVAGADKWHAFFPAVFEQPGDGYLPDMLTAHVGLPLGKLRKLHVGDKWGKSFHQGEAQRLPPGNCAGFYGSGYTCNQSLHWLGSVSVERTG
jgi:hypothetical protein